MNLFEVTLRARKLSHWYVLRFVVSACSENDAVKAIEGEYDIAGLEDQMWTIERSPRKAIHISSRPGR